MSETKRVLILCTGNSARSQMAEGLLRRDGGARFEVESAGTHPGHVRPEAVEAMREVGIDISGHRSKSVDEFAGREFDVVITVCDNARENCPVFPARTERVRRPPGKALQVRKIADAPAFARSRRIELGGPSPNSQAVR